MSAAQGEFSVVPKGSENPFFRSRYADLADVVASAAPVLTKHGLSISQWIGFDEKGDVLTTVLMHKSGQFISDTMRLHLVKVDPQGQGSSTTYARRYSYMAALGLVAGEDDDGNRASGKGAPARSSAPRPNGSPVPQPTAKPPEKTQAAASAKQRGMIFGRAAEKQMSSDALANVLLAALGQRCSREFDSQEAAHDWLQRAVQRLPGRRLMLCWQGSPTRRGN